MPSPILHLAVAATHPVWPGPRAADQVVDRVGRGGCDWAHHQRQPCIPMRVCGQICRHGRRVAFVRKNDQQARPARDAGRRRAWSKNW